MQSAQPIAQPEHRLALALVRAHFGDVPQRVCAVLTTSRLSFPSIVRQTHLRVPQVSTCVVCSVCSV